jgi:hypothetical protein
MRQMENIEPIFQPGLIPFASEPFPLLDWRDPAPDHSYRSGAMSAAVIEMDGEGSQLNIPTLPMGDDIVEAPYLKWREGVHVRADPRF